MALPLLPACCGHPPAPTAASAAAYARCPQVYPQPFTPEFLSNRSERISPELAAKIVAALRTAGLLDGDGQVTQDPRYSRLPWRAQLASAVPELAADSISIVPDASAITGARCAGSAHACC